MGAPYSFEMSRGLQLLILQRGPSTVMRRTPVTGWFRSMTHWRRNTTEPEPFGGVEVTTGFDILPSGV